MGSAPLSDLTWSEQQGPPSATPVSGGVALRQAPATPPWGITPQPLVGRGFARYARDLLAGCRRQTHPVVRELGPIRNQFHLLSLQEPAREQVAKFYKTWFDLVAATPPAGRSMALFQDLSAAFAVGRALPDFENEGTARRPESVVEPLMLNCL
jgi:hypothetical protein